MTITESIACDKEILKPGLGYLVDGSNALWKRQPQLLLHKGEATANVHMDCVNPEAMSSSKLFQAKQRSHTWWLLFPGVLA